MKQRFSCAVAVVLAGLAVVSGSAEARRLGGGKSVGTSSHHETSSHPSNHGGEEASGGTTLRPVIRSGSDKAGASGTGAQNEASRDPTYIPPPKRSAEEIAAEARARQEEEARREAERKRLAAEAAREAERQRLADERKARQLAADEHRKDAKRQQEVRRSKCVILPAMSDDEIAYCRKVWAEPDL